MTTESNTTLFVGSVGSEAWKSVVGYEGWYAVSNMGRVRSRYVRGSRSGRLGKWRILKPRIDSHGYLMVSLYLHGKAKTYPVAHLVADAFLPSKNQTDEVVRHLNDIHTDNKAVNLARGTRKDNAADSMHNGTSAKGALHGQAKLTEDQVREIRRLYATGNFSQRELARRFDVSPATINLVIHGKRWRHIAWLIRE